MTAALIVSTSFDTTSIAPLVIMKGVGHSFEFGGLRFFRFGVRARAPGRMGGVNTGLGFRVSRLGFRLRVAQEKNR